VIHVWHERLLERDDGRTCACDVMIGEFLKKIGPKADWRGNFK
jgi:hypothetical protein